ncbi:hypothetical protein KKB64_02195 [Patescibacteria group bacterium]|nr:hypothetical protein [Patescibacteria group bacterium]MBU1472579.1 hypothetical protein [Patescibacteria group bacterium]MBU2459830.1 hypothetical protein [Patescibacteria group bacterium]MBU2544109.1 hypothetical protein [Patescibacteria group bacterium]
MSLAKFISRLSHPFPVLFCLSIIAIVKASADTLQMVSLSAMVAVMFAFTAGLLIWAIRKKRVKDWDISDRRQRMKALTVLAVILSVYVVIIYMFANAFFIRLFFMFFVWFMGFFAITARWKISGHVGVLTLAIFSIIQWFGWRFWLLYFAVPLVAWARVADRRHTVHQVIAGGMYSLIFEIIVRSIFI